MAQCLRWERGDSVLDVGCGTGRTTQHIAQQGVKSVVGIDQSPDFIRCKMGIPDFCWGENLSFYIYRYTKENAEDTNVSFSVADIQRFSELEPSWLQSFDKAVSFYVLHLIRDKRSALENIRACLKPGGQLLMIVPTDDNVLMVTTRHMSSHRRWGKYLADCPRMMPWSADDREGLSGLAEECGFEVLSCECPLMLHWYSSEEATISAMLPFLGLHYIPAEEHADFLSDWWASVKSMTDASGCSALVDQAGRVAWTFSIL
ncbi:tRNA U34 carboxymethyltransferase-like [Branchiostoma floridae]|uniref:tRNA U34 carboxymethyltransferase-like n=1 Tax=Branchiostoma floridae TaxID=7739 RepID=A0A9J7MMZ8_BRAFL|nr:tRNA U34 carboxymethyltransferase-like [Branchiostoma floridae]